MARVPYFDMSKASPEFAALMSARRPLNLYRMLPHAGPAGQGFLKLGGALLREGALDAQLREVAILRVGLLSKAGYEVHQHKRIARKTGLSDAKIAALEVGADTAALNELERKVLRFTDQLVHRVKAPDDMWQDLSQHLDHRQMAELVLTVGFYMMVCRFLENFEVDIESPGTAT
jgi:4-carboxymuconolactone decarboxylase